MKPGDDPDLAFDPLPRPYQYVAEVIDEVLEEVGDHVNEIARKRRLAEHESALPMAQPSVSLPLDDTVTCVASNPDDSNLMVVGTSLGQILVFDGTNNYLRRTVPFHDEAIGSVTLGHSGAYLLHPQSELDELHAVPRDKIVVAGTHSPEIFVYDACREFKGLALTPVCCVEVERVSTKETDGTANDQGQGGGHNEHEAQPPGSIAQMRAHGTLGALSLFVLMLDGACNVYLCPHGTPEQRGRGTKKRDTLLGTTIQEEQDEEQHEHVEGQTKEGLEFQAVETIKSPTCRIQMHDMLPLPVLSEPKTNSWLLEAFGTTSKERTSSTLVHCVLASKDTNVIKHVALDAPPLANGASAESADAAVHKLQPFVFAAMQARDAEMPIRQSERRWLLTAKTTAVAAVSSGVRFAVGMESGAIALFSAAPCPTLRAMLPAHYTAVAGVAFCGSDQLISVGRDSYVHLYNAERNSLSSRFLLSPPPSAPPAAGIVVSSEAALALVHDDSGNQRLIDMTSGQKIAKIDIPVVRQTGWVNADVQPPQRLLACSEGVGILKTRMLKPRIQKMHLNDGDAGDNKVESCMEQHLHYFDHRQVPGRMRDTSCREIELDQSSSGTERRPSPVLRDARSSVTSPARPVRRSTGNSFPREALQSGSEEPRRSDSIASVATQPAQLTAVNLQKVSGAGGRSSILGAAAGGGARSEAENWQARVRAYCRHEHANKAIRKQCLKKAVDQARSRLESASEVQILKA